MGVSKNRGTPKWMVYNGKPYWNGWFGGTTIFGNIHMVPPVFWLIIKLPLASRHAIPWLMDQVWLDASPAMWFRGLTNQGLQGSLSVADKNDTNCHQHGQSNQTNNGVCYSIQYKVKFHLLKKSKIRTLFLENLPTNWNPKQQSSKYSPLLHPLNFLNSQCTLTSFLEMIWWVGSQFGTEQNLVKLGKEGRTAAIFGGTGKRGNRNPDPFAGPKKIDFTSLGKLALVHSHKTCLWHFCNLFFWRFLLKYPPPYGPSSPDPKQT